MRTEGKWEVDSSGDVFGLFDQYGDLICRTPAAFETEDPMHKRVAKDNAEFICTAVNAYGQLKAKADSHDGLIELLQQVVTEVQEPCDYLAITNGTFNKIKATLLDAAKETK